MTWATGSPRGRLALLDPEGPRSRGVDCQRSTVCAAVDTNCIVEDVGTEGLVLIGRHVRLEALEPCHVDGLVAASAGDPSLYQWSPVPRGEVETTTYVNTALAWRNEGSAVPF